MYPGYYEESLSMNPFHTSAMDAEIHANAVRKAAVPSSPEEVSRIHNILSSKLSSVTEDPATKEKVEEAIKAVTSTEPPAYVFFVTDEEVPK